MLDKNYQVNIQMQVNPSKNPKNRQIQKFKLNFSGKVLTKRKKAIIIPVQFDWNASNERMIGSVAIEIRMIFKNNYKRL